MKNIHVVIGSGMEADIDKILVAFSDKDQEPAVYDCNKNHIDFSSINLSDDSTLIINAHGNYENNVFGIQLNSNNEDLGNIFSKIKRDIKIHVELFSCYSGAAISSIENLPLWSTLITFTSDENSEYRFMSEEILLSSSNFGWRDNPFIKFVYFLLIGLDTLKFAIRTESDSKIFISSVDDLKNVFKHSSGILISQWRSEKLKDFVRFCSEIEYKMSQSYKEKIKELITLYQDNFFNSDLIHKALNIKKYDSLFFLNFCGLGNHKIIKLIIDSGYDINVRDVNGWTPLHYAARKGNIVIVGELIRKGALLNTKNKFNDTPLDIAVQNTHLDVVRALINAGAEVNTEDNGDSLPNSTPLSMAAANGNIQLVRILIKAGALVNTETFFGTALYRAAENDHKIVVKELIRAGASVNARNSNAMMSLHIAVWKGNLEIVRLLLKADALVNERCKRGYSPLVYATFDKRCKNIDNLKIVRALINAGASVNESDGDGNTPLHKIADKSNISIAREFIKHGAFVNCYNNYGETPLHRAARGGDVYMIRFLIRVGAIVGVKNKENKTPLRIAIEQNNIEAIHELMRASALANQNASLTHAAYLGNLKLVKEHIKNRRILNEQVECFGTPLYIAAKCGHLNVVKALIRAGAPINDQIEDYLVPKLTPLDIAVREEYCSVAEELINAGAEVNKENKYGFTPLHWAALKGSSLLIKILIKAGAEVNVKDNYGRIPLHVASEQGSFGAVKELVCSGAFVKDRTLDGKTAIDIATERQVKSISSSNKYNRIIHYLSRSEPWRAA